jgi:hypothetical protein
MGEYHYFVYAQAQLQPCSNEVRHMTYSTYQPIDRENFGHHYKRICSILNLPEGKLMINSLNLISYPALSELQAEIDRLRAKLSEGGEA